MNTVDFNFLTEMDNNPLIVFNSNGKIIYLNDNAEILMGYAKKSDIYKLTINNAAKDYGIKHTKMELHYKHLNFYAISVGYSNDEWIAIRLYYRPLSRKYSKYNIEEQVVTDVNKMLSVAIHQFTIDKTIDIRLFADSEIPATLLNQNNFLKLLRKSLSLFKANTYLDITLKLDIGDQIIVNNKSYKIIILKFQSNGRYCTEDKDIDQLANELCIVPNLKENSIAFDIPLITPS